MRRPKTCIVATFLAICLCLACAVEANEEGAAVLRQINRLWDAQRSEIATARIRVRLYRGGNSSLRMTPDEVKAKIDSFWLGKPGTPEPDESSFQSLYGDFVLREPGIPLWGNDVDVLIEGRKIRETWAPAASVGTEPMINMFNGESEVWYDPVNVQYSVFTGRSNKAMLTLDYLRFLPQLVTGAQIEGAQIEGHANGRLSWQWRNGGERIVADETTGFVYRYQQIVGGSVVRDILQYSPVDYPGGIVFASLVADSYYTKDGGPYLITLYHVTDAEFNIDIAEDSFVVGAPRDKRVVDFRAGIDQFGDHVTTEAVTDVVAYLKTAPTIAEVMATAGAQQRAATDSSHAWRLVALIAGGVGMILFGVWLWRRQSSAPMLRN